MQKEKEADLILRALQPGDVVVLLDEGGREMRSVEFAEYMKRKMNTVGKRLVFVVGGPYGFSRRVYEAAQEKISLSDGAPHLRGAALPGHEHPARQSLPPRIKQTSSMIYGNKTVFLQADK